MIEITELKKSYQGTEVLKDITLSIQAGDIYGLVGRSGAGKSTLLRCINGLERYDSGSLKVEGIEVKYCNKKEFRTFSKNICMIFKQFSIMERRNVVRNIALPLECWGVPKETAQQKVKELVKLVGLEEKAYERPRSLSGGQKQRVAIARALALDSKILLCDEATSALDPKITKDILALLRQINETLGITIVIVTHEMSVIRQVCNKVAVLESGRIAAEGTVEDILLHHPQAFNNLVGEDEKQLLPQTGSNLRIVYTKKSHPDKIFSAMAIDLHLDYRLVSGKLEQYRDNILGSVYLNIAKTDEAKVLAYLKDKEIMAEVV